VYNLHHHTLQGQDMRDGWYLRDAVQQLPCDRLAGICHMLGRRTQYQAVVGPHMSLDEWFRHRPSAQDG
jgi:hypothetical protein